MINVGMGELLLGGLAWTCLGIWCALPFLGVVLLFEMLFRRRIAARFHCFLWLLVAARMMLPISFESPFSLNGGVEAMFALAQESLDEHGEGNVSNDTEYDVFTYVNNDGQQRTLHQAKSPDRTVDYLSPADASVPLKDAYSDDEPGPYAAAVTVPTPSLSWEEWLTYGVGAVWGLVTLALLFRGTFQSLRFRHRLRQTVEVASQDVVDQVLRVCDVLRVGRRPRVKEVADLTVPAVFGVWRPTICLPVGTIDELTSEQFRLILMHEVAHVKRRDGLVASITSIVRTLHWYNPLAWFVFARIRENMEQAADDMALHRSNESSQTTYGHLLLQYASESCSHAKLGAIGLMFPSKGRPLARRIKMLNDNSTRNHWAARLMATLAVIFIAISGLTDASTPALVPQAPQVINLPKFEMSASPTRSYITDENETLVRYDLSAALERIRETQPDVDAEKVLERMLEPGRIEEGYLVLTANEDSHAQTRQAIEAVETTGYWEIQYEVRFISGDIKSALALKANWETSNVTPIVDGTLTQHFDPNNVNEPVADADGKMVLNSTGTSITPLIWTMLSDDKVGQFIRACNEDTDQSIFFAPKVSLFNGQSGRMTDESLRPFVTGIKPIRKGDQCAFQPIIQVASEGTRLFFRGVINEEGELDLRCVLTMSSIGDVSHANLPIGLEADPQIQATVQVPETFVSSIEAIGTMMPSQSLLIASPTPYAKEAPRKEATAMFFMVTPRWSRGEE